MLEYVPQMVNLLGLKWPGGPFNGDTTTIRCGGYIDKFWKIALGGSYHVTSRAVQW